MWDGSQGSALLAAGQPARFAALAPHEGQMRSPEGASLQSECDGVACGLQYR
jgi:hypothetical protein